MSIVSGGKCRKMSCKYLTNKSFQQLVQWIIFLRLNFNFFEFLHLYVELFEFPSNHIMWQFLFVFNWIYDFFSFHIRTIYLYFRKVSLILLTGVTVVRLKMMNAQLFTILRRMTWTLVTVGHCLFKSGTQEKRKGQLGSFQQIHWVIGFWFNSALFTYELVWQKSERQKKQLNCVLCGASNDVLTFSHTNLYVNNPGLNQNHYPIPSVAHAVLFIWWNEPQLNSWEWTIFFKWLLFTCWNGVSILDTSSTKLLYHFANTRTLSKLHCTHSSVPSR